MGIAELTDRLRQDAFTRADAALGASGDRAHIGAEVELIPVDAVTGRRCPILAGPDAATGSPSPTLPILRRLAARYHWVERPSSSGAPVFVLPDGGALSYEPGGQIEVSSAPCASVSTLVGRLRSLVSVLCVDARAAGIDLLAVGLDPFNAVDDVPLQLSGARYTAMDAYFAARGGGGGGGGGGGSARAGARMMRQTAAFQVTVDGGDDPVATWRVLSAAAPYVTAIFANSSRYLGRDAGFQSARAHTWRTLDRARTGLPAANASDPAAEYVAFALAAPAMLHRSADGTYPSFEALLATGRATNADWAVHLTTLFPEVRPRRLASGPTFEVRSADAISPRWYAAPLVLLAGIAFDPRARHQAAELLGPADADLLPDAARDGLRDPVLGPRAADLFEVALGGAARLGDAVVGGAELEAAREFGCRYTWRSRSPADNAAILESDTRGEGAGERIAAQAAARG